MIQPRPAGFWIRAVAAAIDFGVFFVVLLSFRVIGARVWGGDIENAASFRSLASFFTVVFAGAYTTVLHSLAGQTIGKMIVGVRVVGGDDGPPPFGAALLRFIAYFASAAPLTLGFAMAGLRRDKRALHDLIAGTRVDRSSAPEPVAPPPLETPSGPAAAGVV
jgi:uncharacterized RDD family membrane protein YckC